MGCREDLEAYLRENKVPYQSQHHAVAYTAQEVAASEHIPGRMLAKVVMVLADGKLSMLVLPAPARVDLDKAAAALGAKEVRLAPEDAETLGWGAKPQKTMRKKNTANAGGVEKPRGGDFPRQP